MAGVRIPIIGQETGVSVNSPVAHASAVGVDDTLGRSLTQAGHAVGQVAHAVAWQQEQDAKAWTSNALPDITLKAQEEFQKRKETANEAASDFTPGYLKWFDDFKKQSLENAPDAASKKFLGQHLDSLRMNMQSSALHFEAQARQDWRANQFSKGVDSWSKIVANDPSKYDVALTALNETIPDVGPEQKTKLRDVAEKSLRISAGSTAVINDPRTTLQQVDAVLGTHSRKLGPTGTSAAPSAPGVPVAGGFDAAVAFTLEHEGGYNPKDANGKAVNFGVNQGANPDVDVKNLTKEKAAELYKSRYWNAIGGDDLSKKNPGMAIAMFDTAVVAGPGRAKDMLEKSGGDVGAFMDMREKYLNGLIAKDPEKFGKYKKAWDQRNADLRAASGGAVSAPTDGAPAAPTTPPPATPPWMASMSAPELLQLRQHAESQIQQVAQQAQTELRLATQNAEAQAQAGIAPTDKPKTRQDFATAFTDPTQAEHEYQRYSSARDTATSVAGFKNKTTEELVGILDGKSAQKLFADTDPNDPAFAVHEHNRKIAEAAAAQVIQARQKDPWAYAIQNKEFGAQIIDPNSKDFGAQLSARAAALPGLMQKYGVGPTLLSAPEASALSQQFQAMPADQRIGMLTKMRDAIRDDQVYGNLMNTIRKDSPVTAMAGNIAAVGGQINLGTGAVPVDEVARRIAIGEDLLNKTKSAKGEDGNRGGFQMPNDASMRLKFNDYVGESYAGFPDAEAHAFEAFRAYYASQAAAKGIHPASGKDVDDKLSSEALIAATGGVTSQSGGWLGGGKKVVMPYGMSAPEFKDKVAGTWQRIGPENGYTKTDVSEIALKPTGENGKYMVMSGSSWMPGKDGKPIIMDLLHYQYPPAKAAPGRMQSGQIGQR